MTKAERKCIENKIFLHAALAQDEKFKVENAVKNNNEAEKDCNTQRSMLHIAIAETLEQLLHMEIAEELDALLDELDTLEEKDELEKTLDALEGL